MIRPPSESRLRSDIVRFAKLTWERGLLVALDGNLSARLSDELLLCTRAGCHKGLLVDDDVLVVDMQGEVVRGEGRPTSEIGLHLGCYRQRRDVRAVIHAHPPTCVAFTVAGVSLARCVLPEVVLTLGAIPTLEYETTGSQALARQVAAAVREHDAVLMDHHGTVCVGTTLLDAFCKLETLEMTARVMRDARALGGVRELPAEEATRLRTMGLKRYGGPPEAVAKADRPGADLPGECLACSGCGNPGSRGIAPPQDFHVARITATPIAPQCQGSLEREIRRAIAEALGR